MFNRFNSYNLIIFDIHEKLKRFIHIITAYVMMNDEKLSFNIFIERNDDDRFIIIVKDVTSKKKRLQLKSIFIVH